MHHKRMQQLVIAFLYYLQFFKAKNLILFRDDYKYDAFLDEIFLFVDIIVVGGFTFLVVVI